MSWLLDADVLCQPVKAHGERAVIEWLEREQDDCYTSAIVTGNDKHFRRPGLKVFNPFAELSGTE